MGSNGSIPADYKFYMVKLWPLSAIYSHDQRQVSAVGTNLMLALVSPTPPSRAQFGDRVGALYAVPNRFSTGGGSSCLAWLAGDGRTRIDQNGCIHFEHG